LAPAQDGVAAEAAGDHQELYDPPRKRKISHASPIPAMDTPGNCSAQWTQTNASGRPDLNNGLITFVVRTLIENERTAMAQHVTRQPDGPGKRIGRKGEITGIGPVAPGGAKLFRERLPQIQAEAGYWETRVGTVHDFRVTLIDNDTRILFTIVYDGDFKTYIEDILREAGPWLDEIFLGVWEGSEVRRTANLLRSSWVLLLNATSSLFATQMSRSATLRRCSV
jgi:hypothetical protein